MKRLGFAMIVALMATGCGGGGEGQAEKNDSPAAEASEKVDPYAYNLGERALKVGETRTGEDVRTTLVEVKNPLEPDEYRDPEKGNQFVGLRLEQCLDEDVTEPAESAYNGEWAAVTPGGEEYGGDGSSWDDWPSPKFPELVEMIPGRCIKGWINLEVPEGTEIDSLLYRPGGTPVAEWLLGS